MISYWWVPILILWYSFYGYFSVKNNHSQEYDRWFWISLVFGLFPLWAWVSKNSKNLVFDSMLYDVFLFLSFNLVLIFFHVEKLSPINLFGICLIFIGFILMRL